MIQDVPDNQDINSQIISNNQNNINPNILKLVYNK